MGNTPARSRDRRDARSGISLTIVGYRLTALPTGKADGAANDFFAANTNNRKGGVAMSGSDKPKNNDGASLVAALVLMTICVSLSVVILSLTIRNADRTATDADERRALLSVASAVMMFSDGLTSMSYEYSVTSGTVPPYCGDAVRHCEGITGLRCGHDSFFLKPVGDYSTVLTVGGDERIVSAMQGKIKAAADFIAAQLSSDVSQIVVYSSDFEITADGMTPVTVTLTMDGGFDLSLSFDAEGCGATVLAYTAEKTSDDLTHSASHSYGDPETACEISVTERKTRVDWHMPPKAGEG